MIKTYVTSIEHEYIKRAAGQAQVSVSRYVRQVCLGVETKSKVDKEAVLALLQVNQDLSRLGNLFKLAVDQGAVDEGEAQKMFSSIVETKNKLLEKARVL
jgi:hypothetical protein